jgi:hypothetical protein
VHNAAVWTHKAVTQAVESRLSYARRFKGKKTLTSEERVAERLVYSRFFGTQAADRGTNGVNGVLAAPKDKRVKVNLHAAVEDEAARILSNRRPGEATGAIPIDLLRGRTRVSRTRSTRTRRSEKTREGQGTPRKARARGIGLMVCTAAPSPATQPPTTCDIACNGACSNGRLSTRARKPYNGSGRGSIPFKNNPPPQDSIKECRY